MIGEPRAAESESGNLPDRLVEFVAALREHEVAVGPGETVDAAQVMTVLGLADRPQLREGLASALLRRSGQRTVFDDIFDLYFPAAVGETQTRAPDTDDIDDLREQLAAAVADADDERMRALAAAAVEGLGRFAGYGSLPGGWSAYQTLKAMRPEALLAQVLAQMGGVEDDTLEDRLARGEAERRLARFRTDVQAEARRRTAETRGRARMAKYGVAASADQVDFVSAHADQIAEMRRLIYPLSRKLATRLAARRRRARRGQIDLRRTLRRSMSTGGVPVKPAYRVRKPGRPDLIVLCDMSGSVARFADFTLLLVQALRDQFSRVRAFAFVETTDEITGLLSAGATDPRGLATRIHSEARLTRWDGHSDYGHALGVFTDDWPDAVGTRSSVLILGDGRTNYGDPNLAALRTITGRARRVYWLNPERAGLWNTGDSAAEQYARVVEMHECRNVRQLYDVVSRILPV
ncbi:MAG TPA: VWA domain-containing protein [Streptosporangiaceae bacterium]|jgi:hypothetical protein